MQLNDTESLLYGLALFVLVLLLAFFSLAETSILSVNRYRLKHLAKHSQNARRVQEFLAKPDKLLGVILLGNNVVTIVSSSIATIIAYDLFGEGYGLLIADVILAFILLVFSEVSPKTLAAIYPEKIALPISFPLKACLALLYPAVWLINVASNGLLGIFGISLSKAQAQDISKEELRTVIHETSARIPSKHRKMLLSILDLEKVTVDDIMVPRNEVVGIELDHEWDVILDQLANTQHTFLPVYRQDLNNIIGVMHAKKALHLAQEEHVDEEKLKASLEPALFIPEGTPLTKQLINFQKTKQRFAVVVDEYGESLGIITLEDILEEIVGEFTTDMASVFSAIREQEDGSYMVDASLTIREFNRISKWKLPTQGPKTINGLVIEQLQFIPEIGTCCLINGHIPIEVVQVQDNRIRSIKILPPLETKKVHH